MTLVRVLVWSFLYSHLTELPSDFPQAPDNGASGMTPLKRLTLITRDRRIVAVHYPLFPSDSDPQWVIEQLRSIPKEH